MKLFTSMLVRCCAVGLLLIGVLGCYPGSVNDVSELDTVLTLFDDEKDFSEIQTYVLIDTVVRVGDDDDDEDEVSNEFDQDIIDVTRRNLDALGYVEVEPEDEVPDVFITLEKSVGEYSIIYDPIYWWDWWGWYPWWPGYPPGGWYPGYPWCCAVSYSYPVGSVFIKMYDTEDLDEDDEEIPNIWLGAINGLATGSDASIRARINDLIDQAFEQSPYLRGE
jgi:hypothetical protein